MSSKWCKREFNMKQTLRSDTKHYPSVLRLLIKSDYSFNSDHVWGTTTTTTTTTNIYHRVVTWQMRLTAGWLRSWLGRKWLVITVRSADGTVLRFHTNILFYLNKYIILNFCILHAENVGVIKNWRKFSNAVGLHKLSDTALRYSDIINSKKLSRIRKTNTLERRKTSILWLRYM